MIVVYVGAIGFRDLPFERTQAMLTCHSLRIDRSGVRVLRELVLANGSCDTVGRVHYSSHCTSRSVSWRGRSGETMAKPHLRRLIGQKVETNWRRSITLLCVQVDNLDNEMRVNGVGALRSLNVASRFARRYTIARSASPVLRSSPVIADKQATWQPRRYQSGTAAAVYVDLVSHTCSLAHM